LVYDLVVVGGGMGGLATAALAGRLGLRTALLEAHTKLGGCTGYFRRPRIRLSTRRSALPACSRSRRSSKRRRIPSNLRDGECGNWSR
jgi:phytoene dehydrogenase-like protein